MTPRNGARRAPQGLVRRFLASRTGMGATEFAVVAPFLLFLYLGGTELSIGMTINRKVEHAAGVISDLVSKSSSLTSSQLEDIFRISKAVILPYNAQGLKLRVTSVSIDPSGQGRVSWSCPTTGMATLAAGASFPLPAEIAARRSGTVIVTETLLPYVPLTGYSVTGAFNLGGISYYDPRDGTAVTSSGCSTITL